MRDLPPVPLNERPRVNQPSVKELIITLRRLVGPAVFRIFIINIQPPAPDTNNISFIQTSSMRPYISTKILFTAAALQSLEK